MKLSSMGLGTCLAAALAIFALPAVAQVSAPSHPLVGKIFDTRTGVLVELTDASLIPKLFPCAAITLLGEVHDNADHHKMRGALVKANVSIGRVLPANCGRGSFVFEHISADQQAGLDRFYEFDRTARRLATANDLFRLIGWDTSGWPGRTLFKPLMQEVVRSRRTIVVGNPSKEWSRRIAKEGLGVLPSERNHQLSLDRQLDNALSDALLQELEASHCGLIPKSAFCNMASAQRYKDAYMAEATQKAANAHGSAVLFAGNGHIRSDRGVGAVLRRIAPERTVIAVAFVETEDGKTDPATYGPRDPAGKPAADYIAFALPAKREDPCAQMRSLMKK